MIRMDIEDRNQDRDQGQEQESRSRIGNGPRDRGLESRSKIGIAV
jgi:hypothetical protein